MLEIFRAVVHGLLVVVVTARVAVAEHLRQRMMRRQGGLVRLVEMMVLADRGQRGSRLGGRFAFGAVEQHVAGGHDEQQNGDEHDHQNDADRDRVQAECGRFEDA